MFGTILLTVFTLMLCYVTSHLVRLPFIKRHNARKLALIAAILVWILFYLGRFYGHDGQGVIAQVLEFCGMLALGVVFLMSFLLLLADIVTGFGFIFPGLKYHIRSAAVFLGLWVSIIAILQGVRPPTIVDYPFSFTNLPDKLDGATVVAISDTHVGSLIGADWLEGRIDQILNEKPDMILILGDFFEGHGQLSPVTTDALSRLKAPLGVWAVPGNHEFHDPENQVLKTFEKAGIHILRNQWTEIMPGFVLAGVDDLTNYPRNGESVEVLSTVLAGIPKGFTILLSHTPWQMETAAERGVNLMLSGHTHGGQIWPFDHLVQIRYPLLEGIHQVKNMTTLVSRGAGTWGPRMRLWRPGEIMRIKLKKSVSKTES